MNNEKAEKAIQILSTWLVSSKGAKGQRGYIEGWFDEEDVEAFRLAINAIKQPSDAMKLLDDGTLKVKVTNVLDIKRVMLMDDNVIYDSYYPDRPKGEWLDEDGDKVEIDDNGITEGSCWCSVCGEWLVASDEYPTKGNFCPSCGADMRGDVM